MSEKYLEEYEAGYTPRLVMEEASRCLLCHDAPCSKACPAGTDPAKFIRSVRFKNIEGAVRTVRENNILGGICARVCPVEKYCEKACSRTGIDKPINIAMIQRFITDYESCNHIKSLEKEAHQNIKVNVDVANYKEKNLRRKTSEIKKIAYEVQKTKVDVELEPMNSYERREIHNMVDQIPNVTTESIGEGLNRHIVIKYVEDK